MIVRADRDQCWRDFAGWRVNYDAALLGLAKLTMAADAPWSSARPVVAPAFQNLRPNSEIDQRGGR